jgi:hypothetical protein
MSNDRSSVYQFSIAALLAGMAYCAFAMAWVKSVDPFRTFLGLGPLAVYLLALAAINLSRRPRLVPGQRDLVWLGWALAGLVVVGPVELFVPRALLLQLGTHAWLVWATWLCFYGLLVTLAALLQAPRLTIYNATAAEVGPTVTETVRRLDPEAAWSGETLVAPLLGVQLRVDEFSALRNVSVCAVGTRQSLDGWRVLEDSLRDALRQVTVPVNPRGLSLLLAGLLLLAILAGHGLTNASAVAQGFCDMLQR